MSKGLTRASLIATIVAGLTVSACSTPAAPVPPQNGGGKAATSGTRTVKYELTGAGKASNVSFSTDKGMTQEKDVQLPWSKEISMPSDGVHVFQLSGGGGNALTGKVTCKITVDGKVIAESTAAGDATRASCTKTSLEL